jgi:quinol monooxygenase YgiN
MQLEHGRSPAACIFEMVPLPDRPDDILLAECVVDAEAHRLHVETPHQKWFQGGLRKYASKVDIHIIADDDPQRVRLTFEPPA